MKVSFNEVILMGNICNDLELKYTPGGTAVVEFSVAQTKVWFGANKEKNEKTNFFMCSAFGPKAEAVVNYHEKGDPIFIKGEMDYQTWKNKDGQNRSKIVIKVNEIRFLKPKGRNSNPPDVDPNAETIPDPSRFEQSIQSDDDVPF